MKSKVKKVLALLICLCVLALFLAAIFFRSDFLEEIQGPPLSGSSCPMTQEAFSSLSQPFYFLAEGKQSYVFINRQGDAVLKFFKSSYLKRPWYAFLPLPQKWLEGKMARQQRRCYYYEHSYLIADLFFKQETGLIFLGKGNEQGELPIVQVEKKNRRYPIDLNKTPFVLQKRGEPFPFYFHALFEKEGIKGVEKGIETFLKLVEKRISLGIVDEDHEVFDNFGVLPSGEMIHLDPGRYALDVDLQDCQKRKKQWWSATHQLEKWLRANYPEALPYFQTALLSHLAR